MKRKLITATILLFSLCVNAQNNMSTLSTKEQSIVKISALTSVGNTDVLKQELNTALNAGLTINEIKEVLIQLYAYCGFPRSLNAINTFIAVLDGRKAIGITDVQGKDASPISNTENKYAVGKKNLQTLTKREETQLAGANAFAPTIDAFLKEHLFADIFSRDVLTFQERELATISALAVMIGAEPQLKAHLGMGANTGLTESQLAQVISLAVQVCNAETIFPKGQPLSNEWFVGNAFLQPLIARDKNNDFVVGSVTFEPNARTNWHTHPKGQVLIVIAGNGFYQEKGKPTQPIKKGDIVNILENIEHWHGASATSQMTHIAITNFKDEIGVTWLKPVTDEEYISVQ